jgi:hypothetical protein
VLTTPIDASDQEPSDQRTDGPDETDDHHAYSKLALCGVSGEQLAQISKKL